MGRGSPQLTQSRDNSLIMALIVSFYVGLRKEGVKEKRNKGESEEKIRSSTLNGSKEEKGSWVGSERWLSEVPCNHLGGGASLAFANGGAIDGLGLLRASGRRPESPQFIKRSRSS